MSHERPNPIVHWPVGALALLACAGCLAYPQRISGPLALPAEEVGEPAGPGAATVTVQRDSDPVWLRMPGERGFYPVPYYRKRERIPVGAQVRTGAGGRAEILWSPDATAVVLFDEGRATLGDPERDQPTLRFQDVTHALLVLTPEDRVELPGGSVLAGDPAENTGPVFLEMQPGSLLRLTNQSKRLAGVLFREERLEVGPGESIDLPLLPGGAGPSVEGSELSRFETAGIPVAFVGEVERTDEPLGVSLRALGRARILALGVETRLEPQGTARFSGLTRVPPTSTTDSSARP